MAIAKKPKRIHLFTYQAGFGDCFLLRFVYSDKENKHVLIDFGTLGLPAHVASDHMKSVANDIKAKCGGKLDAIVATHRHLDHISGFATAKNGKGTGDIIRSLNPDVVLQPWTEQLDLAEDAQTPIPGRKGMHQQTIALNKMNEFAATLIASFDKISKSHPQKTAEKIKFIGEDNIKNVSAVKNLSDMGPNVYAYFGEKSGMEKILPGVKISVLGPPTIEQSESITKMRSRDPEYWNLQISKLKQETDMSAAIAIPFPQHKAILGGKLPMSTRWIAQRVCKASSEQMLQIVTMLDKQMNNTSLILLFEVGGKKMLFPGDAQIENWQYALSKPGVMEMLSDVDVYKVGHHGSLNATPKKLWSALQKRGKKGKKGRLTTVLSTMRDKHGDESRNTEVPRRTLLSALQSESDLHNTEAMANGKLCEELIIELQ